MKITLSIAVILIIVLFLLYSCKGQLNLNNAQNQELPTFKNKQSIHLQESTAEDDLNKLEGLSIEKVTYVIHNYRERSNRYEGFHLVDAAIFLKLSNGKVLSWLWNEDGSEVDYGYYYSFCLGDLSEALKKSHVEGIAYLKEIGKYFQGVEAEWIDVSDTKEWKRFLGKPIVSVDYRSVIHKDKREHLADVIFKFKDDKISISCIDEPDPEVLPNVPSLEFAPIWTIVIFDEKILETNRERKTLN